MVEIQMNIFKENDTVVSMVVELDKDSAKFRNRVGSNRKWYRMKRIPHETICSFHGRLMRALLRR